MQNVETKVAGDTLTIRINLAAQGKASASGKSLVIASTHGNQTVDTPAGPVKLGLNVYRPIEG